MTHAAWNFPQPVVDAALLDDAMGTLFLSSGHGTGFTANLSVNYRRPIPHGTRLRVECAVDRVELSARSGAKKVFLTSRIVGAGGGGLYAEATAIFVVKNVAGLESSEALLSSIRASLGL